MKFVIHPKAPAKSLLLRLVPGEREEVLVDTQERRTLVLGYGERSTLTRRAWLLLIRKAVVIAKARKASSIAWPLPEWQFRELKLEAAELGELLATNILLADYVFDEYKTPPKGGFARLKEIAFVGVQQRSDFEAGLKRGMIIGEETNAARGIANQPASEMTPALLAAHAKRVFRSLPVTVTVWDERRLARESMRAILAVGQGSAAKPRCIIAEYRGGKRGEAPIVLVGKGVTFDSGGINLKPTQHILGMNMDMSGAATMLHTLAACARLKVKKNLIALVPAVENMLSGESYRPGDIIRTASGTTIEVQDTDAEGRLILSDVLHYAKRYRPSLVIDAATLTGAAVVALGERASALFTTHESTELALRHIGEAVGDPVWPLPLRDEYLEDIRGVYADLSNVRSVRWGDACIAAIFLKQFTDYPWVHLDIAPRMTSIAGEHLAKGSIGAGVQLLVRFLSEQSK